MIIATLFPAPSNAGRVLEEFLKASLDEMIKNLGLPSCQLTVVKNATQYDMLKAVLNDDLVIFDGSLEYDDDGNWCKQYECATANVISNDNIFIIEISYNELIDVCKLFIDNLSLTRDYMHTIIKEDLYDTIMDL